jgi:hypothetical protein
MTSDDALREQVEWWESQYEIKQAEVERLRADHLAALKLSREWMVKHDHLLGFIQARPVLLKELIELEGRK